MEVHQPHGLFCEVQVRARLPVPPEEVFSILTDPDNQKIFRNVQKVVSRNIVFDDKKGKQVVEVVQEGRWKLLFLSGSFPVHLRVEQDKSKNSIKVCIGAWWNYRSTRCIRSPTLPFAPVTHTLILHTPCETRSSN